MNVEISIRRYSKEIHLCFIGFAWYLINWKKSIMDKKSPNTQSSSSDKDSKTQKKAELKSLKSGQVITNQPKSIAMFPPFIEELSPPQENPSKKDVNKPKVKTNSLIESIGAFFGWSSWGGGLKDSASTTDRLIIDEFIDSINQPNQNPNEIKSQYPFETKGAISKTFKPVDSAKSSSNDLNNKKKYYSGNADQFFRTVDLPPLDEEGFALFQPEQLGPDLCIIFRRMLNYKFRSKVMYPLELLGEVEMVCLRALPDIPVAIEMSKEVDCNARMRPRSFAICGPDQLPRYYALEYTPTYAAILNCMPFITCFRQPYNLAVFGLDGEIVFRILSGSLERNMFYRIFKEWFCISKPATRMTMQMGDGRVFGTLVEYRHCGPTQNLRLIPCNPEDGKELDDENIFVEWQTKCRWFDYAMIYCGCKPEYDSDSPMVIDDKKGHKFATTRPWSGRTSEDLPFFFTIRFTKPCPVEVRAFALGASLIYNHFIWESNSDHDICTAINCIFCTLRCWNRGGPMTMDYDNWTNFSTRPTSPYLPWVTVQKPQIVNHRRI